MHAPSIAKPATLVTVLSLERLLLVRATVTRIVLGGYAPYSPQGADAGRETKYAAALIEQEDLRPSFGLIMSCSLVACRICKD
jgi:hypothetical protein